METEYTYLLHLLGAYLRGDVPNGAEGVDWEKLTQLAQIHNVPGILGYMAMKYPICLDSSQKKAMRGLCLNTIAVFARRHSLAQTMVQELEKAGIDHILMKGYVLREDYPVPELRTFTDIDLVIRPEDRKKCHERMMSLGFQLKTDWEPVYSYYRGEEYYEIHTEIMEIDVSDKADYRGWFRRMWDYACPVSKHSYRFTPEFHFVYMLTHIAKHVHGSGAGIRMYLDVAAFLQHHGAALNWNWIETQLRELKLYEFASVVLTAVESWFGVGCPMKHKAVSEATMRDFLEFTMEAGTFGHHNRDGALAAMKYEKQEEPASRLRLLLRRAFPKAQTIQTRYTYLQEKPWLLPAAWVHRLVKTRDGFEKHAQEMQQIIHADRSEVIRLQKLTKDIGL